MPPAPRRAAGAAFKRLRHACPRVAAIRTFVRQQNRLAAFTPKQSIAGTQADLLFYQIEPSIKVLGSVWQESFPTPGTDVYNRR
jgi:hypothetical protein